MCCVTWSRMYIVSPSARNRPNNQTTNLINEILPTHAVPCPFVSKMPYHVLAHTSGGYRVCCLLCITLVPLPFPFPSIHTSMPSTRLVTYACVKPPFAPVYNGVSKQLTRGSHRAHPMSLKHIHTCVYSISWSLYLMASTTR